MSRLRFLIVILLFVVSAVAQQPAATPQTQPAQSSPQAESKTAEPESTDAESADKKPSRTQKLKKHLKDHFSTGCVALAGCWDARAPEQASESGPAAAPQRKAENRPAPPVEQGESSSRDTRISLDPPAGESAPDFGGDSPVTEMTKWDPHKAAKNVEVGDYYFKQKNYRAAESRYREALEWKSNDASAIWGLAQSLEQLGRKEEARQQYAAYLKILPKSARAVDARAALERLKQ